MRDLSVFDVEELASYAKVTTAGGGRGRPGIRRLDPIITLPVEPIIGEPLPAERLTSSAL